MILLWRLPGMTSEQYQIWTHVWKEFATRAGEMVMVAAWSPDNIRRAWDSVMRTPGRYVIWARPEFVPSVAMFSELDYLLDQNIRVVVQQRYNATFAPGSKGVIHWEPVGVDPSLVVFQLNGQDKCLLPPGTTDIWDWLAEERNWVYRAPQRFSGGHGREAWSSKSLLGETVYAPFTAPKPGLPIYQRNQLLLWNELLEAWGAWVRHGL